jgi:CubicO group peptidase (beta-lactamase class C family)
MIPSRCSELALSLSKGQAFSVVSTLSVFSVLSVLSVSPTVAQSSSSLPNDAAALDSVQRYIAAERSRQQIPGLSVAVLRGDQVLLARGFGLANIELSVPASDSTIYQSGSLGKQFTAAAVLMLASQDRLRLDDKITTWIKDGAGVWNGITVRHLLTHTSGVAEYTDSTFDYRKDYTEEDLVRFAASRPLDFPPGERWSYSNTGYLLLGVLIRRVTGKFYGDVLHDLFFAPLGMKSTRVISEADIVMNRAAGYRLDGNRVKNQEWVAPSLNTTADGALYLTVNDLAKWAVALNQGRTPSREVLRQAWTPARLNGGGLYPYGFGWSLTQQRGHPRIGHTGAWQGFQTAMYQYPALGLTVIVMANLAQSHPGPIATGIAGIFEPAVMPPHVMATALQGPSPRVPIQSLLQRVARGDSAGVTPELHRFLLPWVRTDAGSTLADVKSWTALGCDAVAGRGIVGLTSAIEHICYARGVGKDRRVIVSVFYTDDWRAALFEIEDY